MTTTTRPAARRATPVPAALPWLVRDRLGAAHYERFRQAAMRSLPPWHELRELAREDYRRRTEYLVPTVLELLTQGGAR